MRWMKEGRRRCDAHSRRNVRAWQHALPTPRLGYQQRRIRLPHSPLFFSISQTFFLSFFASLLQCASQHSVDVYHELESMFVSMVKGYGVVHRRAHLISHP